ncbi:MAG: carboxypeptidase-like regulatory domain-containing protein [Thermoanaerobaculia bacterium]
MTRSFAIPASADRAGADSADCWVDEIDVRGRDARIVLNVWPLGFVTQERPDTKPVPATLGLSFVDEPSSDTSILETAPCTVQGATGRCRIPASRRIDLRLEWGGLVPSYAKNIALREGETLDLSPAPSASARVVDGDVVTRKGSPLVTALVRLVPATAAEMTRSDRLLRTREARTDLHGRYRIEGVEPGTYRLESRMEGLPDAVRDSIVVASRDVHAGSLVHSPPGTVEVQIDPPMAASGTPWTVRIIGEGRRAHEIVVVASGVASPAGFWESDLIPAGSYGVVVMNELHSEVANRQVEVNDGQTRVSFTIAGIAVRGTLVSGDDPVSGSLVFADRKGTRVRAVTDAEGRFEVMFPSKGSWDVTVTVPPSSRDELRLAPVTIDDDTEKLDLVLPAGRIRGTVRNLDGERAEAFVRVRRKGRVVAETRTGDDGTFLFAHLDEKSFMVEADGSSSAARPIAVDLSSSPHEKEIELTLQPLRVARGVILGAAGRPLSGAIVRVVDEASGVFDDTIADAEGLFSVELKSDAAIDIVVIAPPAPVIARRFARTEWQGPFLTIAVPSESATLRIVVMRVPPWPILASGSFSISLQMFLMPSFGAAAMREFVDGAFQFAIEPGMYRVCRSGDCRNVTLPSGAIATVDYVSEAETP